MMSYGKSRMTGKRNDEMTYKDPIGHGRGRVAPEVETLFNGRPQVGTGVHDGLSALIAAKWNFDFLWVSSFCCSASAGLPDVGIIGVDEMLTTVRTVYRCTPLPVVVDLDSGYGDAIKVYSVVQAMAQAGAAALCIEDNPLSKRCSLYGGYDRVLVVS
jgi:phosphoenolpyruvate phosphomutase